MPKTNPYKVLALFLSISFLTSCTKDDETSRPVDEPPPAKKLKRVYESHVGSPNAEITDFAYDSKGRLVQHDFLRQDTTTSPATVIFTEKTTLTYDLENEYPASATVVRSNGYNYSVAFFYDNQSRIIREELQLPGGGVPNGGHVRIDYEYLNPQLVAVNEYHENPPFNNYTISDTIYLDDQNRTTQGMHHEPAFSESFSFDYDTKNNAYSGITAFKHVFSLNGFVRIYPRRAPNNFTRLQGHYTTSSRTEDQVINYVYDAESYPVTCQGHIEWVSNTTTVVDYNIKYQYY
jgi:hypothetical protein